mmetsp:Transcript_7767/g.12546  ORF Transcript_7767/g.12546 Transcript_7767/m.12546 type:complete len:392 (-) Transcript_7767:65-1240(-)|eukprot:CAMPEP_0203753964 /NCGR_PEP_ID=MMETSP0098-20131031/7640_1 /ASSEMBLY_ACC=CAM_ASM_000208 /TAXON_ID=96639 /ORGANISM=" , Strain NY0313808BC1" /LENGTH=391 /DNA_ID=CAMNT_0050644787 /DNA_START=44 /DNA_END=1219 /DNA_ORIENTATION=-
MDFLNTQASKYGDLAGYYQLMADLYQKKLWHQLTEELGQILARREFNQGRNMIDLYENFISKFEGKLNQLKFVQIASVISQQYYPSRPFKHDELNAAIKFMEFICEKRGRLGEEAYLVAQMSVAQLLIKFGDTKSMQRAQKIIDEAQPVLQSLEGSGAETVVNSSFYRVSCEYYKVVGPADEFYRAFIQFLAYTPQETMEPEVQRQLATDMSLAAIVGENVFNFGEVIAQPILKVLDGTNMGWLHELLKVFSAGDIDQFTNLCVKNKQAMDAQPVLVQNLELIKQKIALLCLMQIVFVRPPDDRVISLTHIAQVTRLDVDQAEWLLMKAMSKGLIKGKIDQVEGMVHISWLKPRVLDREQLATVKDKLALWKENVDKTLMFIESETPDLFQ